MGVLLLMIMAINLDLDNVLQVGYMRDWSRCETFLEIAYKVISASKLKPLNRLDVDDFFNTI